jgi:hypothetical protein
MRIELNGYTVSRLNDGRYYVVNTLECVECVVDSLDDAMSVIQGECNA